MLETGSRVLLVAGVCVLALACGGESDDRGSNGLCVGDGRSPGKCSIVWDLLDPCPILQSSMTIELAVYDGGCPADADLKGGATATAIHRASFKAIDTFAPVTGLSRKNYGFAFFARDLGCTVTAFGCTEADLSNIKGIRTAICDWSAIDPQGSPTCSCIPTAGGGCPIPETCANGVCSGASG